MVVCKFYLKGYCKFGNQCRFEHVRSNSYDEPNRRNQNQHRQSSRYGDSNDARNQNFVKPSHFQGQQGNFSSPLNRNYQEPSSVPSKNQKYDKYHWSSSNSNRFAPLSDPKFEKSMGDSDDQAIIKTIRDDINLWLVSHMWPYSSYSCSKGKNRCIEGLPDIQPEELRTLFYMHGEKVYLELLRDVDDTYSTRKQELLQMTESTRMSVLSNVHSSAETNPSSSLSIYSMYGPGTGFTSNTVQKIPEVVNQPESEMTESGIVTAASATFEVAESAQEPKFSAAVPQSTSKQPSLFKSNATSKQADSNVSSSESIYTDESILTEPELKEFKSTSFTLGKIPMRPPPKSYCR